MKRKNFLSAGETIMYLKAQNLFPLTCIYGTEFWVELHWTLNFVKTQTDPQEKKVEANFYSIN